LSGNFLGFPLQSCCTVICCD